MPSSPSVAGCAQPGDDAAETTASAPISSGSEPKEFYICDHGVAYQTNIPATRRDLAEFYLVEYSCRELERLERVFVAAHPRLVLISTDKGAGACKRTEKSDGSSR